MIIFLTITAAFLLMATCLPMTNIRHWCVRDFDFPRVQLALLAYVTLAIDLIYSPESSLYYWSITLSLLFCALWQTAWILPYTPLWKKEVHSVHVYEKSLKILTSNVLQTNHNSEALLKLVKQEQPDILVTLESNQWWEDQLKEIEAFMPHTVKCPLENLYGMHLYSKLPLSNTELQFLVEDDVPSIHTAIHLDDKHTIETHFVHPAPPSPTENETSKEREIELLLLAKALQDSKNPIIVTGDLNDVAWSKTTRQFRALSKLLDPRIGRGMFNTFHASYPFLRWPLDHLFHSKHFKLVEMRRLPSIGSDHFPLLTHLAYAPDAKQAQDDIEVDQDDFEETKELFKEENVSTQDIPELKG
ncbi:MAG TPA: endonuclease [Gammaproteobacteria bacterium]|nr:endonuclease [Gammaproteobacteria bacterium]HBF09205.1 endonuclease [Gammaproteobacteria bacterium]HCK93818.1 endonuclease [Gammaproteobacteria bacterium]|tara:strand:+ start:655 stop:1731 length:1077 start_codon:yes stop_codon:yes gene_type:complete